MYIKYAGIVLMKGDYRSFIMRAESFMEMEIFYTVSKIYRCVKN
jgi:hypothetical protein